MQMTPELYRQISRVVCTAARKMGRLTDDDAEDLTQDVLLKLWKARGRIRLPKSLNAFVYRVAITTRISSCRSRSSYQARLSRFWEMTQRDRRIAVTDDECEEPPALWRHVDALDPRTADVIRRHFRDGQSYAEIGQAIGVSNCTAHNIVQRGLRQLRARLTTENIVAEDWATRTAGDRKRSSRRKSRRPPLVIAERRCIPISTAARAEANTLKRRGCPV